MADFRYTRWLSLTLAVLALGCDKRSEPAAPDNTGRNRGDTSPAAKTPPDQANNSTDTRITADIRKAVMDDKALSTNAHNCKIITDHGAVTLRGPVASQAEKDSIESKAKAVAGVVSVSNELEIAP